MMTASQLAKAHQVHMSTIGRAITRAELPKGKGTAYDDRQVAAILSFVRPSPTLAASAQDARLKELEQQVKDLRAQLAAVQCQMATQGQFLQILADWGKNTARIIRAIWRRMPDYQQGQTPGEFPAVQVDTLDAYGREILDLLSEEARKTRRFFGGLDKEVKKK